ncbi:hypothetical protein [Pseudomonas sp. ICMP 460]|uniref:hypothetical protein n=1 Tax=Pseudomonas sp. ICMP 460 TaxID=1718917 RepID=UPI000C067EC6|nr:hypothetical protein [Pseudomonas sp. ICMP 460]PHN30121.1 hypothetical protein AO240_09595 [Pseudomonas sp. ICMP 460]
MEENDFEPEEFETINDEELDPYSGYEYRDFELDPDKPLVLLLGSVGGEGSLNLLTTTKRQYKKKMLNSTPANWETILHFFLQYEINSVIVKITDPVFHCLYDQSYDDIKIELFSRIAKCRHIAFVQEHTLKRSNMPGIEMVNSRLPQEMARYALEWFEEIGLDITPYNRTAEMNVLSENFLVETEKNLIFRMYIPKRRIWSEQTEKLLQLFKDYLGRVSNIKTRLDQRSTDDGTVYEFHGEEEHSESSMQEKFNDFSSLMDLCANDITAAEALLKSREVNEQELNSILTKFSKEAKRLKLDIKHEGETKLLSLRHRMESELTDIIHSPQEQEYIQGIINSIVTPLINSTLKSPLGTSFPSVLNGIPQNTGATHISSQVINIASIAISQEIRGNKQLTEEDLKLIELIEQYGGKSKTQLESAVHELADTGIPEPERLGAKQKLKRFLYDVGSKATDLGLGVLQTYIEKKLGL